MKPGTDRLALASTNTDIGLFRAELLQHLGDHADAYPIELEQQFPHIVARIADLWGTHHMESYLQSLIVSDRPKRQGFPVEVIMEIYMIYETHATLRQVAGLGTTGYSRSLRGDIEWWR